MVITANLALILVILFMFVVVMAGGLLVIVFALSRSGILGGTAPERVIEPAPAPEDDALDIVRARYARNEITRDEYEKLRADLET